MCLLESPFLEPLLRTLLRTLLPIKAHCKAPSKNPSQNLLESRLENPSKNPSEKGSRCCTPPLVCKLRSSARLIVEKLAFRCGRPSRGGADVHDPKAWIPMSRGSSKKLRSEKLRAELSFPKLRIFKKGAFPVSPYPLNLGGDNFTPKI